MKMLKNIESNRDPCGTLDSNISKALQVLFIFDILFTFCLAMNKKHWNIFTKP